MLVSWRSGRRPSEGDAALERRTTAAAAGRRDDAQLHVDVGHHRAPPWQLQQPKTSSARHVLHSPPPSLCVGCTEKMSAYLYSSFHFAVLPTTLLNDSSSNREI